MEKASARACGRLGALLSSCPELVEAFMTRTSLLAASAALSVLCLSFGAQAGECLRGERLETRLSTAVQRTDRLFQRVGDRIVRVGDRMFSWVHRRPRA